MTDEYAPVQGLFEELRTVALQESAAGNFPIWLLEEVLAVVRTPGRCAAQTGLVATLIEQIRDFDPYAGVGCFDTSCGPEALRTTLRRLTASIKSPPGQG